MLAARRKRPATAKQQAAARRNVKKATAVSAAKRRKRPGVGPAKRPAGLRVTGRLALTAQGAVTVRLGRHAVRRRGAFKRHLIVTYRVGRGRPRFRLS